MTKAALGIIIPLAAATLSCSDVVTGGNDVNKQDDDAAYCAQGYVTCQIHPYENMAGTVLKSYRWRNGEWVFQYQSIAGNGGKYKCTLGPENVYGWMRLTAEKPDFSLWSIDFLYEPIQVPYVEIDPEMLHGFIEEKQPR